VCITLVVYFRALGIYDGVHRVPAVDEYTLDALRQNLSIMAVDAVTNKLLGVAINGLCRSAEDVNRSQPPTDDKFSVIIAILAEVNRRAPPGLYKELGGGIVFDIKMVTTEKLSRRSGLGTDLIRRSVELAKSLGYKVCKTEATGQFSRKAFERLGFEVAAELPYTDCKKPDGSPAFAADAQLPLARTHRGVCLLVKHLDGTPSAAIPEEN